MVAEHEGLCEAVRTLSATLARQVSLPVMDESFVTLLTASHPQFERTLYLCPDPAGLVSRGITFEYFPFEIGLVSDTESLPEASILMSNVDSLIGAALQQIRGEVSLVMEVVLRSDPNVLAIPAVNGLKMVNISGDDISVSGTVTRKNHFSEPFPARRATLRRFPGLFPP